MLKLISGLFTGIWSKVAGLLAVLSGLFFLFIRYQSNKIDTLKDSVNKLKATEEKQQKQDEFKAEVVKSESEKVSEAINESNKKSKLDRLNDN